MVKEGCAAWQSYGSLDQTRAPTTMAAAAAEATTTMAMSTLILLAVVMVPTAGVRVQLNHGTSGSGKLGCNWVRLRRLELVL